MVGANRLPLEMYSSSRLWTFFVSQSFNRLNQLFKNRLCSSGVSPLPKFGKRSLISWTRSTNSFLSISSPFR